MHHRWKLREDCLSPGRNLRLSWDEVNAVSFWNRPEYQLFMRRTRFKSSNKMAFDASAWLGGHKTRHLVNTWSLDKRKVSLRPFDGRSVKICTQVWFALRVKTAPLRTCQCGVKYFARFECDRKLLESINFHKGSGLLTDKDHHFLYHKGVSLGNNELMIIYKHHCMWSTIDRPVVQSICIRYQLLFLLIVLVTFFILADLKLYKLWIRHGKQI